MSKNMVPDDEKGFTANIKEAVSSNPGVSGDILVITI